MAKTTPASPRRGKTLANSAKKSSPKNAKPGARKRYVAFLRSINIGGRTLPMPALAAMFTKAGCTEVKTYIQSGNVVFTKDTPLGDLAATVERAIKKLTGFESPVVIRSAQELSALLKDAPFVHPGGEKPALYAFFLTTTPAAAKVAALAPNRSPGEQFAVRGNNVYLLCPNGVGVSKLTNAYFDSKLGTTSTGRNFRTIRKMLEMCDE
jgi:uncharacterized protein (DUF1697 family)